ncbi:hypothetical protein E4U53_005039, partial [Claviceps sorghi]
CGIKIDLFKVQRRPAPESVDKSWKLGLPPTWPLLAHQGEERRRRRRRRLTTDDGDDDNINDGDDDNISDGDDDHDNISDGDDDHDEPTPPTTSTTSIISTSPHCRGP